MESSPYLFMTREINWLQGTRNDSILSFLLPSIFGFTWNTERMLANCLGDVRLFVFAYFFYFPEDMICLSYSELSSLCVLHALPPHPKKVFFLPFYLLWAPETLQFWDSWWFTFDLVLVINWNFYK